MVVFKRLTTNPVIVNGSMADMDTKVTAKVLEAKG